MDSRNRAEYMKEYRKTHPEYVAKQVASQKKWRDKNKDKVIEEKRLYYQNNKDEIKARTNAYYHDNTEAVINYRLQKKYGIAKGEYDRMLEAQNGRCAICKALPEKKRFAVDHDHVTGAIRKILCSKCNVMIGLCDENEEVLISMIDYLKYFKSEKFIGSTNK